MDQIPGAPRSPRLCLPPRHHPNSSSTTNSPSPPISQPASPSGRSLSTSNHDFFSSSCSLLSYTHHVLPSNAGYFHTTWNAKNLPFIPSPQKQCDPLCGNYLSRPEDSSPSLLSFSLIFEHLLSTLEQRLVPTLALCPFSFLQPSLHSDSSPQTLPWALSHGSQPAKNTPHLSAFSRAHPHPPTGSRTRCEVAF